MAHDQINTHLGILGMHFDDFETGLMGQFDRSFRLVVHINIINHRSHVCCSHSFDDVFGVFGRRRTPWWQKENVCVRREVLEEGDEEARSLNIEVTGNANFHMQVNSFYCQTCCILKEDIL